MTAASLCYFAEARGQYCFAFRLLGCLLFRPYFESDMQRGLAPWARLSAKRKRWKGKVKRGAIPATFLLVQPVRCLLYRQAGLRARAGWANVCPASRTRQPARVRAGRAGQAEREEGEGSRGVQRESQTVQHCTGKPGGVKSGMREN